MPELESSRGKAFHPDHGPVIPEAGTTLQRGLDLEGNGAVTALPERLTVQGDLRLRGTRLARLPAFLTVHGDVELEGVETLIEIGSYLLIEGDLDLEGCSNLRYLPDYLIVKGDVFLAGTAVRIIPITNRIGGRVYNLLT